MNIILDTNILIASLLFRGKASTLYKHIVEGRLNPCICPSILDEYKRVLSYPKFKLSVQEISYLLTEEIKPFYVMHKEPQSITNCITEDPSDNKFIDLCIHIPDSVLISGDTHIISKRQTLPCRIITLEEYNK
ncbi:MAG TPA: putative toxin-antitoxin system toxin component, PIN family [Treponemataceae bacterium]|jgi:putative PIN family toxin of toxin-antitoxin system|nr:putative toxin-antitoxin system toxin component, PIN family [Treponemataceae bacterium]